MYRFTTMFGAGRDHNKNYYYPHYHGSARGPLEFLTFGGSEQWEQPRRSTSGEYSRSLHGVSGGVNAYGMQPPFARAYARGSMNGKYDILTDISVRATLLTHSLDRTAELKHSLGTRTLRPWLQR